MQGGERFANGAHLQALGMEAFRPVHDPHSLTEHHRLDGCRAVHQRQAELADREVETGDMALKSVMTFGLGGEDIQRCERRRGDAGRLGCGVDIGVRTG